MGDSDVPLVCSPSDVVAQDTTVCGNLRDTEQERSSKDSSGNHVRTAQRMYVLNTVHLLVLIRRLI